MDLLHYNTKLQGSPEVASGPSHLPAPCPLPTSCLPMTPVADVSVGAAAEGEHAISLLKSFVGLLLISFLPNLGQGLRVDVGDGEWQGRSCTALLALLLIFSVPLPGSHPSR